MCHPTSKIRVKKAKAFFGCAGFTLLELLVAMGLSMIILAVAFDIFNRLYDVSETVGALSEMNQNLRAGVNLVARDLTASGEGIPIGGIPIPNGPGSSPVRRPGPGVNPFPPTTTVWPSLTPGYNLGPNFMGLNSDIITIIAVNSLSQLSTYPLVGITASGDQITVDPRTNIGAAPSQVVAGDLIMLTNTNGSALGMATLVDATTNKISFSSGDPLNLNQPAAKSGTIAKLTNPGSPPTYPATYAYKVTMLTYFLDVTTDASHPKLMRQIGAATASPVALDIYSLQLSYDLADGVTTNRRDVTTPNQIRKVNLFVSARSPDIARRTRQYFNNTISTAVTVRNLAYVNKY